MNHTYRLLWNNARRAWIVVGETARSQSKNTSRGLVRAAASLVVTSVLATSVQAGPSGGQVTAGDGVISQVGNTTNINQSSQNLAVNWQSFNVDAQESVNFVQPSTTALAINRILDTNGSKVMGNINANGQVILVNPNGILFGQNAQVNVGALVATALDLTNNQLNSGKLTFSGDGTGSIVNQGQLNASQGGHIALIGNQVSNEGTINTPQGTAALAAGNQVNLTFANNNLIQLKVEQSVLNSQASNGGMIKADGGIVLLSAGAKNALLASVVNNTGVIEALSFENQGGEIVLLAGMEAGHTLVSGSLDASAPDQGDGGFIETSAAKVTIEDTATITTKATDGNSGTWLIDPVDFTIAASGGDMTGATLTTNLASGNVIIQSTSGGSGTAGDLNVNDSVSWSANKLTLNAQNDIKVSATMTATNTASLALEYGQSAVAASNTSKFTTSGASISLPASTTNLTTKQGSDGTVKNYTVITSLGAEGSTTATDLQGMQGGLSTNYAMGADIDAAATSGWTNTWNPVGNDIVKFTGRLDGLGNTISNLTIIPASDKSGLFKEVSYATIQNLNLDTVSITGSRAFIGALAGQVNNSTLSNITAKDVVVTGHSRLGALVGHVLSTNVANVSVTGNSSVTGSSSSVGGVFGDSGATLVNVTSTAAVTAGSMTGGLIGNYSGGGVSDSWASGAVSGSSQVGGLVGGVWGTGAITNSYASGAISGTSAVGGLAGDNRFASVDSSYATGTVTGTGDQVGGLLGRGGKAVTNSYASGAVSGADYVGGLVGNYTGSSTGSYVTNASTVSGVNYVGGLVGILGSNTNATASITNGTSAAAVTGAANGESIGGLVGASYGTVTNSNSSGLVTSGTNAFAVAGLIGANHGVLSNTATNTSLVVAGTGSETLGTLLGLHSGTENGSLSTATITLGGSLVASPARVGLQYTDGLISTPKQLSYVKYFSKKSFSLANDIDMTGFNHTPITFYGLGSAPVGAESVPIFDGKNYTISNLTIIPASDKSGLFKEVSYATIQNLNLDTVSITGSRAFIGALAGQVNNSTLSNITAKDVVVTGHSRLGALVGHVLSTNVANVSVTGNSSVTGSSSSVGGVFGDSGATLVNVTSTAAVTAGSMTGGLIGNYSGGGVSDSWASGAVSGSSQVGGLVGGVWGTGAITNSYASGAISGTSAVGGLAGDNRFASVDSSYATGTVTGTGDQVGGLLGRGGKAVTNSYASGAVSGADYVGGLVGRFDSNGTISNSFSTGSVAGSGSSVGGLNGVSLGSVTTSYWNTDTSGVATSAGGTGFTNAEMLVDSGFVGWDFANTWNSTFGTTNPTLKAFVDISHDSNGYLVTPKLGKVAGQNITSLLASDAVTVKNGVSGSVNVTDAINWSANKLTLNAQNDIKVSASMNATGAASLALEYGQSAVAANNTSKFTTSGASISLPASTTNLTTKKGSDGTVKNYTVITSLGAEDSITATDLQGMRGSLTTNYALGADIDAGSTASWPSKFSTMGDSSNAFSGDIEGFGHTISNLSMSGKGLFKNVSNATIQNLTFDNSSLTSGQYSGLIAGTSTNAVFDNITFKDSTAAGWGTIGMVVGTATDTTLSNINITGTSSVSTGNQSGGVVGVTKGITTLSNINSVASVITYTPAANSYSLGGLVGYGENGTLTIKNSVTSGDVTGTENLGGLVGAAAGTNVIISNSSASGDISGTKKVGGLVGTGKVTMTGSFATGDVTGSGDNVGGIVGSMSSGSIAGSHATGAVTGSRYVGGLAGNGNSINDSYATGVVSGVREVGGLVGMAYNVSNSYATGNVTGTSDRVGGLAGYAGGTLSTNYASGSVTGASYVGGLFGYSYGVISDSTAKATVHVSGNGTYIGGLVGNSQTNASISNSNSFASVTGAENSKQVGGLVGGNYGTVTNSNSTGLVTLGANGFAVGGLIGANYGTVNNATANTSSLVVGADSEALGLLLGLHADTENNSLSTGALTTGGVSVASPDRIGLQYTDGIISTAKQLTYIGYFSKNNYTLANDIDMTGTSLTSFDMYGLSSAPGVGVSTPVFEGNNYTISNLSMSGKGLFKNVSNATIQNLTFDNSSLTSGQYSGLIAGTSTNAVFDNITFKDSTAAGWGTIGMVVGTATDTTLSNINITGTSSVSTGNQSGGVVGVTKGITTLSNINSVASVITYTPAANSYSLGGLVGYGENGTLTIKNSVTSGDVTGTENLGGLVGAAAGTNVIISNSSASGDISGTKKVGGLVGTGKVTMTGSFATGDVTGSGDNVGGIVGSMSSGSIAGSHATGAVTGSRYVGGLAGNGNSINDSYATGVVSGVREVGGLVGMAYNVSNSYATGNVTGTSDRVGGLAGYAGGTLSTNYASGSATGASYVGGLFGYNGGTITNSYATGEVAGASYTGGLVGINNSGKTITSSYSSGRVSGSDGGLYVGGLVGKNYGAVTTSYWDTDKSNMSASDGGAGLTSAQMQVSANYVGLDFVNTWYAPSGSNAATLQFFPVWLDVVANNKTKTYDGAAYAGGFDVSYSGFVNGETVADLTGSLTFGGASQGTITNAGTYGISVSGLASSKYKFKYTLGSLVVNKADLAITGLSTSNKVYDATPNAVLEGTASIRALGSDVLSLAGTPTATFASKDVAIDAAVTVGGLSLTGSASGNYNLIQPTGLTANITKANLAVSGISTANKVYDSTVSAVVSGTAAVSALGNDTVTVSGVGVGAFASKNAADNIGVTVSGYAIAGADSGNYNLLQPAGLNANITKANLIVSGLTAANKVYNKDLVANLGGTAVVNALGNDNVTLGGSVTGAFSDKNAATGKSVTIRGHAISGADAVNYNLIQQAGVTADITKANLSVSGMTASNRVYDAGVAASLSGTAVITALSGDTVVLGGTATGTFADKNAALAKGVTISGHTISGADAGNYNLMQQAGVTADITKANLSVSGLSAAHKVYDTRLTASLSGTAAVTALAGDTVAIAGTASATFADKNAASGKGVTISGITITGADAANYNLIQQAGVTANISKAKLNVTGLTVDDKVYDTYRSATLKGTAAVSALGTDGVSLKGTGIALYDSKTAGASKSVTVSGYSITGADIANYTLVQPSGLSAKISKADLAVSGVSAVNKTYDTNRVATLSGTAAISAIGADTVTLSGVGNGLFADKNAAVNKTITVADYVISGADSDNYNLIQPTGLTAQINKAEIKAYGVAATSKVYDTTAVASLYGAAAVRALGTDIVTVGGSGTAAFSDKNAALNKAVSVTGYTIAGADSANYSLIQPTGLQANISQASLTVSGVAAVNKTYDGVITASLTGTAAVTALGSDNLVLNGEASAVFSDKNVADNKAVSVVGYSLSGTDSHNYSLLQPTGLSAAIGKAELSVFGVMASNKVYDTNRATSLNGTAAVSGIGSDQVSLSGQGSALFANKNVAANKAITVTGYLLSGADSGNYSLLQPNGLSADISKANLNVYGVTASNKVYDTRLDVALIGTAAVDALGTDSVALDGVGSGLFTDKNAAINKTVTVTGYLLSGSDSGNYQLVQPKALTASISKAALAVTGVAAADKVYDAVVTASLTGTAAVTTLGDDSVTLSGTGSAFFADKNVALNKAVTVEGYDLSGTDSANYTLLQPAGLSAGISKANLTVFGVAAQNKVYDTNRVVALTGTASVSALGADRVTLGGEVSALFADKNAATNKSVSVDGYSLSGIDSTNYTLTQPTQLKADISQAQIRITGIEAADKTYDAGVAASLTGTASVGALGTDRVSLGGTANAVFADKNAADNKAVTVDGYRLSGVDSANYVLIQPEKLRANINQANLYVTGVSAADKAYDSVITASLNGTAAVSALGRDTVTLEGTGSAVFVDKSVGTNKVLNVAGYRLSGADSRNYQLVQPKGLTATISENLASKVMTTVVASIALPQFSTNTLVLASPAPASMGAPPAQQSSVEVSNSGESQASGGSGSGSGSQTEGASALVATSSVALGSSGSAFFMMGDGVKMPDNAVASTDE